MRTHFPVASHHGGIIQTSNCFLEKLLREETLSPEPQAEFYKQVLWDGGSREFPITLQASFLAPLSPHTEPHLEVIHRLELASQAVNAQQRHSAGADNSPRRALPQGCRGDGKDLPRSLCVRGPGGRGGAMSSAFLGETERSGDVPWVTSAGAPGPVRPRTLFPSVKLTTPPHNTSLRLLYSAISPAQDSQATSQRKGWTGSEAKRVGISEQVLFPFCPKTPRKGVRLFTVQGCVFG